MAEGKISSFLSEDFVASQRRTSAEAFLSETKHQERRRAY